MIFYIIMENIKNNDVINNIYTSYGPLIGKACENTNNYLAPNLETDNILNNMPEIPVIDIINKIPINNIDIIKNIDIVNEQIGSSNINQGLKIFGYNMSMWTLIFIIIIIVSFIYFIYKYIFSTDDIVTYEKKNSKIENNKIVTEDLLSKSTKSTKSTESDSSNESSDESNSSKT